MGTWVALLRAVNLGKVNKVSMPLLREALTEAGFEDVKTYVQSGNIVLGSSLRSAAEVGTAVRKVVAERFGVDTPVVMRTGAQLAKVLDWNPFPEAAERRPQLTAVLHLAEKPSPAAVEAVLAADVAPDVIAVRGLEVVVAHAETSRNRTTAAALKKISVDGTARNWRTLAALVDLTRESS